MTPSFCGFPQSVPPHVPDLREPSLLLPAHPAPDEIFLFFNSNAFPQRLFCHFSASQKLFDFFLPGFSFTHTLFVFSLCQTACPFDRPVPVFLLYSGSLSPVPGRTPTDRTYTKLIFAIFPLKIKSFDFLQAMITFMKNRQTDRKRPRHRKRRGTLSYLFDQALKYMMILIIITIAKNPTEITLVHLARNASMERALFLEKRYLRRR